MAGAHMVWRPAPALKATDGGAVLLRPHLCANKPSARLSTRRPRIAFFRSPPSLRRAASTSPDAPLFQPRLFGGICGTPLGSHAPPFPTRIVAKAASGSTDAGNPSSNEESNNVLHALLAYVISIIRGIIGVIAQIPGLLKSILSKEKEIIEDIGDSFEGAADAVEDLVKGIAEVARVVEHAADTIADSAEEAQGLLTKLTGDKSDEIADLARAIERAADTLADTAEDTGALLDKVEAQAKDIKKDVIAAVENLEKKLKPIQEAVKKGDVDNVQVDISLEKALPVVEGDEHVTPQVVAIEAQVTVHKVDSVPDDDQCTPQDSVATEVTVEVAVPLAQPDTTTNAASSSMACECQKISSWTSRLGTHISGLLLSICATFLHCARAASLASVFQGRHLRVFLGAAALAIILCSKSQLHVPTVTLILGL